jgi:[ribosomal protein S5]-alanine N-acetyltransferase
VKPEIQSARLRPYRAEDVDYLHRLWTDPQVRKYLWDNVVISREHAASVVHESIACFETHGFGQWVLLSRSKESLIGFCGFRFFGEPREIELLYGITPAYWGQGMATEAARAALRYGFEECGFERVYAGADPPNAASFRVMEKLGMSFSRHTHTNGVEVIYYVLSRGEFEPDDSVYRVLRG